MSIQDRNRASRPSISTSELRGLLGHERAMIVDARPLAAYNGWRLGGEARGGHIRGAVSFPTAWLSLVDEPEVERLLAIKRLTPDRTIVVYGDGPGDADTLAARLLASGFREVRTYDAGFAAWVDEGSPIDRLARFDRLVHADWVRELVDGGDPDTLRGNRHALFHVNFGVPEEYAEGHIPGSFYLDTNRLEDPVDWNRRSPEALDAALRELGITSDTTVILYGRDTVGEANEKWPGRRAGQIAAARAALILAYAGVRDVRRLLDGGYDAWVNGGHPVEVVAHVPAPVAAFGVAIPQRPGFIVDIDEARSILDDDDAALVSVRSWREHTGEVSGYNYIGPKGRIAGDVWGNCGTDAYHMQHYRNVDNTMRAYPEIEANWAQVGIVRGKRVAFYCGTGWRAAETWFYAYLLGWDRIAVYDGGWLEWSSDPVNNAIEVGVPLGRGRRLAA